MTTDIHSQSKKHLELVVQGVITSAAVIGVAVLLADFNITPFYALITLALLLITLVPLYRTYTIYKQLDYALQSAKQSEIMAKNEQGKMLTMINGMMDAILVLDGAGLIKFYNASALSMLDTNILITDKHISTVVDLRDQDDNSVNSDNLLSDDENMKNRLLVNITEAGKMLPVQVQVTRVGSVAGLDSSAGGYIVIIKNIAEELKSMQAA